MAFHREILQALRDLSAEGGWIFWALIVLAFAIAMNLVSIASLSRHAPAQARARISRRIDFCFVLIGAAPLVGLLGTVSGMLTTFSGLAARTTAAPMENISRGISEALITTQTGLIIAVPTFIVGTLLKRRHFHQMTRVEKGRF